MVYFLAKFGFSMLCGAFVSSFLNPILGFSVGAVFLFASVGSAFLSKKFIGIPALLLAVFLGMGIVSADILRDRYPAMGLDGLSGVIRGTVTEVSAAGGNPVYTVKTDYIGIEGAKQNHIIKITGWSESSAEPFDRVSCEVSFRTYSDGNAEEFLTDRSRGVSVYAYTSSPMEIIGREENSPAYYVYSVREKISSVIYGLFLDWHAPFMDQLLIGKKDGLESEITAAFRQSGMSHILAISGMHMVIITGLFEKLLFRRNESKKSSDIKSLLLMLITGAYMLIGGLGMSILRAGFMLLAHYFTKIAFSASKSLDNLGIAIIIVLSIDPMACCDIGFLMSVLSCCSIYIFAPPLRRFIFRILKMREGAHPFPGFVIEAVSVSIVAFLAVMPVSSVVFGGVSLVSPLSNIFAGFAAQLSLIFGMLTVVFGMIPFTGFIAGFTAAAAMISNSLLLGIARTFSSLPFSYADISETWVTVWIFGSALLIILPIFISKGMRYIKHGILASVFVLLFGLLADFIFFGGVSEIRITALEHGTAVACSKDGCSVLITKGLSSGDKYNLSPGFGGADVFISLSPEDSAAEVTVAKNFSPELLLLGSGESIEKYEGAFAVSEGRIDLPEGAYIEIYSEGVFAAELCDASVLYISEECDIMDIEPAFRRAEIIILDGVSPEDFPVLRSEHLVLRKMGGFYSGTSEITVLREGETLFYAYKGNVRKGLNAG